MKLTILTIEIILKESCFSMFIMQDFGVAEFRRFGEIRFQSIGLKFGPQSIEELTILGSIYCESTFT